MLLAGDLTTHGEPEQAAVLADACRDLGLPVVAVLGNHDWHVNRADELIATLEDAGIRVLERDSTVVEHAGAADRDRRAPRASSAASRAATSPTSASRSCARSTARASEEAEAVDAGLRAVAHCPVRIVVLHYAPIAETLEGEPREIWTMLGSDRLAVPITEHEPDLVLHGHAHAGTFRGTLGTVPVFNVSVPVMAQDFWVFEVADLERATTPVH